MPIFEWDERKRQSNLEKHGLDFRDAATVFEHFRLSAIDDRFDYAEQRIASLGVLHGIVVFLVYTIRGDAIRLISMRRASKYETEIYFNEIPD
jgi:hypothetical protein